ncbi:sensor histidine kinase [Actinoplanes sp. CA-131856]
MRTRPWWFVVVPPVLTVMIELAMLAFGNGTAGLRGPTGAQLILIFVASAALLLRLRLPRTVTAVTVLAGSALPLFGDHEVLVSVAAIVALYTLGTTVDRRTAWLMAAGSAALLAGSSALWLPDHLLDIRVLVPLNYVAAAVAVGDSVRNNRVVLQQERRRAAQAELTREEEARRRVREERVRIARDLHDVVAHHITLVNAQAGVAHHLMRSSPDKAYEALAGIQVTSRAALDELRATVGLLRRDDEPESRQPAPSFERIDDLVGSFRTTGFAVTVERDGPVRRLTPTGDLAAYRILQEALTNAGKHGTRNRAHVALTYSGDQLDMVVTNPAHRGRRGEGSGNGLIGMGERAQIAGGTLDAGFEPGGTFAVRVRLPLLLG